MNTFNILREVSEIIRDEPNSDSAVAKIISLREETTLSSLLQFLRGVEYELREDAEQAIAVLRELIGQTRATNEHEELLVGFHAAKILSYCYLISNRSDEVLPLSEEFGLLVPETAEDVIVSAFLALQVNTAAAHLRLGRMDASVELLESLVSAYETNDDSEIHYYVSRALISLSEAHSKAGDFSTAAAACKWALDREAGVESPLSAALRGGALVNLAQVHLMKGDVAAVNPICERAITEVEGCQSVLCIEARLGAGVNSAAARLLAEDYGGALAQASSAHTSSLAYTRLPFRIIAVRSAYIMVIAEGDLGHFGEAIDLAEAVVKTYQSDPANAVTETLGRILEAKGWCLKRVHRDEDAEEAARDAARFAPNSPRGAEASARTRYDALLERIDHLLSNVNKETQAEYSMAIQSRISRISNFLSQAPGIETSGSYVFVLREWNSYTPIIPDPEDIHRGGGYFVCHKGCGVVVDPGLNFLENFHNAGGRLCDIVAIVVTHAHNDHTADVESLLTLLFEYAEKHPDSKHKVSLYLNLGAMRKLSGLIPLRDAPYLSKVRILNPGDSFETHEICPGITMGVLPAYHDDVITRASAVGIELVLELPELRETRRVVFTGDTGLFPLALDPKGKPTRYSDPDATLKVSSDDEKLAIYARYPKEYSPADNRCYIDLFIPHLGSVKPWELGKCQRLPDHPVFYPNHLGLRGIAILLDKVDFRDAIISEFGEELSGTIRVDLATQLKSAICDNCPTKKSILPGDLSIVYDISNRRIFCHEDCSWQDSADVFCVTQQDESSGASERVFVFKNEDPLQSPGAIRDFALRRENRDLPYLNK